MCRWYHDFFFFSRAPGASPLVNSIPAASKARWMASMVRGFNSFPASSRVMVSVATFAMRASSLTLSLSAAKLLRLARAYEADDKRFARAVKDWGKPEWWGPVEGRADPYERLAAQARFIQRMPSSEAERNLGAGGRGGRPKPAPLSSVTSSLVRLRSM
jgi:hypothetical protein